MWIFSEAGIPLVCAPPEADERHDALFAGLITALLSFARANTGGQLVNKMVVGAQALYICACPERDAYVVALTSKQAKAKRVWRRLSRIRARFEALVSPADLRCWNGNLQAFEHLQRALAIEA